MASEPLQQLVELLELAVDTGDVDAAALAVKEHLKGVHDSNDLAQVIRRVQAIVDKCRRSKENAKLATALLMRSELLNAQDSAGPALVDAEEAMSLFRSLGSGKGLATSLEAAFQAHLLQMNQVAGLRAINQEVEALHQAGNKQSEVAVLETLAHAHSLLGEPYSAIKAYQRALEIYRALGDKEGQGSSLHSLAEMMRATGGHAEHAQALDAARQSAAAFSSVNCKWGEDKALATLSSLMAQSGRLEKAPNRQEALKSLKELTRAVGQRNVGEANAAELRLNSMRDLVTDTEIIEHLHPLVAKDPETTDFLQKELGWSMNDEVASSGDGSAALNGTCIKQYSHKAFYLQTILNGMNFGPQFRSVHPYRRGRNPGYDNYGISVSVLPETEAWQMELCFRPGIMDANLQSSSTVFNP